MSGRKVPHNMISMSGQPAQPVVIDRVGMPALMVNSKSRLQIGGVDRIRGDIDIIPSLYMSDGTGKGGYKEREFSQWFQVSVKPHRDLVAGYIPQHTIRGAEFGAHAAASGIDPQLLSSRVDNLQTDDSIVAYQNPRTKRYQGSQMSSFGTESSGQTVEAFNMRQHNNFSTTGRSNETYVKYGTDIEVGSTGI